MQMGSFAYQLGKISNKDSPTWRRQKNHVSH